MWAAGPRHLPVALTSPSPKALADPSPCCMGPSLNGMGPSPGGEHDDGGGVLADLARSSGNGTRISCGSGKQRGDASMGSVGLLDGLSGPLNGLAVFCFLFY